MNPGRPLEERFWSRVEKSDGCWLWTGAKTLKGYGQIILKGRRLYAHRVSWELHNGRPVPDGMLVRHRCDVPGCVRPDHLEIGSALENMDDMWSRGRGHPGRSPGEKNANARFSDAEADIIRQAHSAGTSQAELARHYGVNISTIYRVVHRLRVVDGAS